MTIEPTDRGGCSAPARRDPLTDLGAAIGTRCRATDPLLVCVPHAGAGPAAYLPLARSLAAHDVPARILGVRPTGREVPADQGPASLDDLVRDLAEEVTGRAADAPVLVLGHCTGAPVALHLTRALESRSVPVDRLILVARLLRSTDPADHVVTGAGRCCAEVADRLVTGPSGAHERDPAGRAALAEASRWDTALATHALYQALDDVDGHRIAAPATVVLARDDTLTADYPAVVGNWDLFLPQRRLVIVEHGGHHLNVTRPDLLASVIERDLAALRPPP